MASGEAILIGLWKGDRIPDLPLRELDGDMPNLLWPSYASGSRKRFHRASS